MTDRANEPAAYMRRWYLDGEAEHKVRSATTGRMGLAWKFKLMPVTAHRCLPDDEPLYTREQVAELMRSLVPDAKSGHDPYGQKDWFNDCRTKTLARIEAWQNQENDRG